MRDNMFPLYVEISRVLENAFREIEEAVPAPEFIERGGHQVFRYQTPSIGAAVVQKCARLISGLNASLVLLRTGYVQELGAVFRMLDEFSEDILFLCEAVRTGEVTALHKKYLEAFYKEEFEDPDSAFLSPQKRPTIRRAKIHAAISRIPGNELNPNDSQGLYRTLSQAYSGYVHGASVHILDMYGGKPPRFHVRGMLGTPRMEELAQNTWDYFYRGLITMMMVALSFKRQELLQKLYAFRDYVEKASNQTEWEHPESMIKKEKTKKHHD